jgi:hypothetical protein
MLMLSACREVVILIFSVLFSVLYIVILIIICHYYYGFVYFGAFFFSCRFDVHYLHILFAVQLVFLAYAP